ncbi:unnamed protein product [Cuscuta campestris]|uniref:DUF4219 domain-containing protein n=1 Tax=Cuscuta campestris TaxID=132261 RepID=A0A484L5U2_9ASTE|nr:unnamed protein product [Cuscuta campestris]
MSSSQQINATSTQVQATNEGTSTPVAATLPVISAPLLPLGLSSIPTPSAISPFTTPVPSAGPRVTFPPSMTQFMNDPANLQAILGFGQVMAMCQQNGGMPFLPGMFPFALLGAGTMPLQAPMAVSPFQTPVPQPSPFQPQLVSTVAPVNLTGALNAAGPSRPPQGIGEGQSTVRPPFFDGTNYSYWKERMRIFVQSNDFKIWLAIKNGDNLPMKKIGDTLIPKDEDEYDEADFKKAQLNATAINFLYCALNANNYQKISRCQTANQMWNKLVITYEGTPQVRESKIDLLTHEYELFAMKENELVEDMFGRFSNIVNDLDMLGKTLTDKELMRKILRSLTKEWESKVNSIYEGRDYNVITWLAGVVFKDVPLRQIPTDLVLSYLRDPGKDL